MHIRTDLRLYNSSTNLKFYSFPKHEVQEETQLAKTINTLERHKLLIVVGIVVIAAVLVVVLYRPGGGETLVATKTLTVPANSDVTDSFSYTGTAVNQSMATGCNIPASMKIIAESITSTGDVSIYINNQLYATGTISDTGEVMLTSGCGCSTVCICEIKIGSNAIKITSQGFEGQTKYEIYVKT